jgi:hypothetical protein
MKVALTTARTTNGNGSSARRRGETSALEGRALRPGRRPPEAGIRTMAAPRLDSDFSRIPVHGRREQEGERRNVAAQDACGLGWEPVHVECPTTTEVAVGNDRRWRLAARGHPGLPAGTPAWSDNGVVALSAHALFAPPSLRAEILRHEAIHSAHQRMAPRDDSAAARALAERIADSPAAFSSGMMLPPVPSLLGFPPQQLKPFDQVWLGHDGIIGEIVSSGITVRISLDYGHLGIDSVKVPQPAKAFYCGKHDMKPIPDVANKMKVAADTVAKLNKDLPAGAEKYAAKRVFIAKEPSAYRVANGEPIIVLKEDDLKTGEFRDTLAHEASHGIYEFHSVVKDPTKRTPDVYALAIADLYNQANNTVTVPEPTAKFDPDRPPPLAGGGRAAGLVMVTDTLWSGSGGHPHAGPDEFFASALGAFLSNPGLQQKIFAHYAKADEKTDKKVGRIAAELTRLLKIAKDAEAFGKLPALSKEAAEAAAKALAVVKPPSVISPSTTTSGVLIQLADPSKQGGPDDIKC